MPETIIKKAFLKDAMQLQSISRQTFSETFFSVNSEENMKKYLRENLSMKVLEQEFNHPCSEFYFAELGKKIIGYLKINWGTAQTELKDQNSIEIERIYILKEFHGIRAGQLLFEKAIEISRQKNVEYIWLGVWEQNHKAIGFYKKNGFSEFDKHIFKLGNDEQTDILMKLKLK